jgi:acetyl-CoA acetyltransferase
VAFCAYVDIITAENIAQQWQISRSNQDEFATESQQRVEKAQKHGYFDSEIVPVTIKSRTGMRQSSFCQLFDHTVMIKQAQLQFPQMNFLDMVLLSRN